MQNHRSGDKKADLFFQCDRSESRQPTAKFCAEEMHHRLAFSKDAALRFGRVRAFAGLQPKAELVAVLCCGEVSKCCALEGKLQMQCAQAIGEAPSEIFIG